MRKRIIRTVFSGVMALFLTIAGTGIGICHYTQNTLLRSSEVTRIAENCGYTRQLYDQIAGEWENLFAITGIAAPSQMLSVLTPDGVAADSLGFLSGIPIETSGLESQLIVTLQDYAYAQGVPADQEQELEQNIQDLADACICAYEDAIAIPVIGKIIKSFTAIRNKLNLFLTTATGITLLFILFLYAMQRNAAGTFYYAAISAAAGGIAILGIPAIAAYYNILQRLPFSDSAVKTLFVAYGAKSLDAAVIYGWIYLAVAAICMIGYFISLCALKVKR